MEAKELAAMLDGIEYPVRIPRNILEKAKQDGLVIVYGSSDDLIEFNGAIVDEAGCYDGGTIRVDKEGVIQDFGLIEHEVEECRKWLEREKHARLIEALWNKESRYSWTYTTDIPHATFEVMEEGLNYCRGMVFRIADL